MPSLQFRTFDFVWRCTCSQVVFLNVHRVNTDCWAITSLLFVFMWPVFCDCWSMPSLQFRTFHVRFFKVSTDCSSIPSLQFCACDFVWRVCSQVVYHVATVRVYVYSECLDGWSIPSLQFEFFACCVNLALLFVLKLQSLLFRSMVSGRDGWVALRFLR